MKKTFTILTFVLAGVACLAPTCKTPTASGELTSYFQTDSNIVITGALSIDAHINVPDEARKLINGEWAEFGGIKLQIPKDTALKLNIIANIKTK